jgi:hypothetical protein
MWYETVLLITCSLLSFLNIFLILFVILFITRLANQDKNIREVWYKFVWLWGETLTEIPTIKVYPEAKIYEEPSWFWQQLAEQMDEKESEAWKIYEEQFKNFNWWI